MNKQENDLEWTYFSYSFLFHFIAFILLVAGASLWQAFSPWERARLENLRLINASVKVDMVAMPKHTLQELKSMTVPEQNSSTESKIPDVKPILEKTEAAKPPVEESTAPSFAELIKKARAASEQKKSGETAGKSNLKINNKMNSQEIKNLILAGNKISQGSAIIGNGNNTASGPFVDYISKLPEAVRVYWKLPSYLLQKNYKARVRVYIGEDGSLQRAEIFESSGSIEFDQKAMDAIKAAAPFSAPDASIIKQLNRGDIVLGFPL